MAPMYKSWSDEEKFEADQKDRRRKLIIRRMIEQGEIVPTPKMAVRTETERGVLVDIEKRREQRRTDRGW